MKNLSGVFLATAPLVSLLAVPGVTQTPELRKGVSVQMAATRNAVEMIAADDADSLIIAVTRSGNIFDGVTQTASAELLAKIKTDLASHAGKKIYVKGDARTPYEAVGKVLSAAHSAGATSLNLLTDQTNPQSTRIPRPPMGIEVQAGPSAPGAPGAIALEARTSAQGLIVTLGGRPIAAEALEAFVKGVFRYRRDWVVVLKADAQLAFGDVVRLIDACSAAGVPVFVVTPGA